MAAAADRQAPERVARADRKPPAAGRPKRKKVKAARVYHVKPQAGFQVDFLTSRADITIGGGAAGVGKTNAELLAAARHHHVKGYQCVFFRRSMPQITGPDGLWDQGMALYPAMGAKKHTGEHRFRWNHGATIKMAHLEHDDTVLNWQGTQIALVIFDELTHFTAKQFWYMLSRNRSTSGVQPYMLATCNPDADSWVAELIAWWIEQDPNSPRYGLPIFERAGKLRYFARLDDKLIWGDSRQELVGDEKIRDLIYETIRSSKEEDGTEMTFGQAAKVVIKSLTFIPGKLEDNKILQRKDPGYRGRLLALTRVEKERLLYGNWKARQAQGEMFRRAEVKLLNAMPTNLITIVRCWDLAATEESTKSPDPDYTSSVKMAKYDDGRTVVLDFINVRKRAHEVRQLVRRTAENDTELVRIRLHQDPAQAGKDQAQSYVAMLNGFIVHADPVTGDKVTNAEPFAAQWQAGNVDVLRAPWNDEYFGFMEAFPDPKVHDDPVDASATGYKELNQLRPILEVNW
jgi:predicted phage terminase large subunit-like protein